MFVKGDLYGYKGVYHPQLYPELRRIFSSGESINIYAKYMLTGKDFFSFVSADNSFNIGAQYNFDLFNKDVFIKFDYFDLKFTSDDNKTPVETNKYYIGLGMGF